MMTEDPDKNDDETIAAPLDTPPANVRTALVPKSGEEEDADVDVAVAVATDMAITGG